MHALTRILTAVRASWRWLVGSLLQVLAFAVVLSPVWIVGWIIIDSRNEHLAEERRQAQYAEEQRLWDWGYRTCLEELVRRRTGTPELCEEYADQVKGAANYRD